jgi:hypothetical protein
MTYINEAAYWRLALGAVWGATDAPWENFFSRFADLKRLEAAGGMMMEPGIQGRLRNADPSECLPDRQRRGLH